MKNSVWVITFASALALAASAAMAHYENNEDCGPGMMGGQMPMSQTFMQQNRAVIERMVEEPDLQKRREMMHQYMQATHGRMMGAPIDPDMGPGSERGWMHRQMEMMNHRLDEMQRSIEQLLQQQNEKN